MNAADIFAMAGSDIIRAGANETLVFNGLEISGIYADSAEIVGAGDLQIRARSKVFWCKSSDFAGCGVDVDEQVRLKSLGANFVVSDIQEKRETRQTVVFLLKVA